MEGITKIVERPRSRPLDEILGKILPVLDDGFVRAIDYMGTDQSIVQAARVSYGKGTKKVHQDRGLIRYLMRNRHTTPFEMCEIKFHVRVPMDSWRQWIRHRTANVNEYSTRYSEAIDAAQRTRKDAWRKQGSANRQSSTGRLDIGTGSYLTVQERRLQDEAQRTYKERLSRGVAREQARKDLPLSTYTEAYWKIDLHNLFHFLALRMDVYAQLEIRNYAKTIGHEVVAKWCPVAWEAFLDYQLNAIVLSGIEKDILSQISQGNLEEARRIGAASGWTSPGKDGLARNREREEFEAKLRDLRLPRPW